jgi:hypothetical protein
MQGSEEAYSSMGEKRNSFRILVGKYKTKIPISKLRVVGK